MIFDAFENATINEIYNFDVFDTKKREKYCLD